MPELLQESRDEGKTALKLLSLREMLNCPSIRLNGRRRNQLLNIRVTRVSSINLILTKLTICIPISWNIYEKFKSFWLTSIGHALQIILGNSSVTLKNGLVSCLLLSSLLLSLLLVASTSFDSLSLSGFTSNNHCRETFKITSFFFFLQEDSHTYISRS